MRAFERLIAVLILRMGGGEGEFGMILLLSDSVQCTHTHTYRHTHKYDRRKIRYKNSDKLCLCVECDGFFGNKWDNFGHTQSSRSLEIWRCSGDCRTHMKRVHVNIHILHQ